MVRVLVDSYSPPRTVKEAFIAWYNHTHDDSVVVIYARHKHGVTYVDLRGKLWLSEALYGVALTHRGSS
jgi:hypothetical protein